MLPAARKYDGFGCPVHGGGVIDGPCCPDVLIGNLPAARTGDAGPCGTSGARETITRGNPLVLIGGMPAAGVTHATSGGGSVLTGSSDVFIGNPITDENGNLVPTLPECSFVIRLLDQPPSNLGRFRSAAQITAGPPIQFPFPGQPVLQPAVTTTVTIRGHTVVVVAPGPGVPVNGQVPSVAQVASSLGALSDEQLRKLHSVVLNPVTSPHDAYWQKRYKSPNHRAAAESAGGQTTIYPQPGAVPPGVLDRMMQHETGHLVWEKMPEADRAAWQEAMASDRRSVSRYGDKSIFEDFSEALVMYSLVKGTPCEATMKAAFPGRFALIEKLLSKGGFKAP